MDTALIVLGGASLAYGAAMGVLYPARGFWLVWVVLALVFAGAGLAMRLGAWGQLPACARHVVAAVALLALAAVLGTCALIGTTAAATAPDGLDYLVVLGANLEADGTPKRTLAHRLDAAAAYLADNPETRCIVSGGQGPDEPCTEASSMARYLEQHGVDPVRITLEERSTTTAENLRFSRELIDDAGASVGVVTNDFHVFRALGIARRQGLVHVYGISAPTDAIYVPQAYLRECAALGKDALAHNL